MSTHLARTPPLTDDDRDQARWEDDGGAPQALGLRRLDRQWLRISAALSRRLPDLADRDDVIVTCRHQTHSGAPAAFSPPRAELEISTDLFTPLDPTSIDPSRPGDEERYPAAWGVFTHEAAHAAHSRWTIPPTLHRTAQGAAAGLLEEARAEHAHLRRRPQDRRFLRTAVQSLILADITRDTPTDTWHAAWAAGLILARRDAGVLASDETRHLENVVTTVLGANLLHTLQNIWTAARTTADDDTPGMLRHATAWCDALAADPHEREPAPDPTARRGQLAEAIHQVAIRVTANDAEEADLQDQAHAARTARRQARAAQSEHGRHAAKMAREVFTNVGHPVNPSPQPPDFPDPPPVTGSRPPTTAEKAAAGRLARALRAAAYRERTTTHVPSTAPPGRLDMRQALALDAQLAAGATPTATPWQRTVHQPTPTPPLRVGIAVDVSYSMAKATQPIASAAWILARAAALTDPDSRTATIAYHSTLTAITAPGRAPRDVTQLTAKGGSHNLADAIDALTAGLNLTTPGTGRLLVIASDGRYSDVERRRAQTRISTLRTTGCAILWLAFAPHPQPLPGTTLVQLADPTHAATTIAKAATNAVRRAQRH
ncbi:VWA domain-containing protein [Streptomyces sp. NPDC127098]|uniref:VWA domain-containing protein n=1 Tax=Streptomyces sp. NPDC127098 TaxID=3347137 RepID=UPI00365E4BB3